MIVAEDTPTRLFGLSAGWGSPALVRTALGGDPLTLELAKTSAGTRPVTDPSGDLGGVTLPRGLAVDPIGRLYVLDAAECRVRRRDPCDGEWCALPCVGPEGAEPRELSDPRGIAISRDGDLLIADTGNRRVQVFSLKGLVLRAVWTGDWEPVDVAVDAAGNAYVADRAGGTIHVFDRAGRRAGTIGAGELDRPIRVVVDCDDLIYVVEEDGTDAVVLDRNGAVIERVELAAAIADRFPPIAPELRELAGDLIAPPPTSSYSGDGTLTTAAIDSEAPGCVWHRVELAIDLPPGCRVEVRTLTSETRLSAGLLTDAPERRWSDAIACESVRDGRWDCLVQSPPGRFLWARLRLVGDGQGTPRVDWMRIQFPRRSSLQHLPAVYSEDPEGRPFLDRFLAIFDSVRDGVERQIAGAAALFDPDSAPAVEGSGLDFLGWLGSWLDLHGGRRWPEPRRRRFLREAHRLFELRGTPAGLELAVELSAGVEARVLEHFKLRRWLWVDRARLGDDSALWGREVVRRLQLGEHSAIGSFQLVDQGDPVTDPYGVQAHRFTVYVALAPGVDDGERAAIERVVQEWKPAHAEGDVVFLEPRLRLGGSAIVGLSTVIGDYPSGVTAGTSRLGRGSVLGHSRDEADPPRLRLGPGAHLGRTSIVD